MSKKIKLINPLSRDGTSQSKRFQNTLDPDYIKLDERSHEDLAGFAKIFAREIQFYNLDNIPDGDWQTFFEDSLAVHRPHLALFKAFLNLFSHAQSQLNQITRRHLDFYFREVLGLKRKPARPDKVQVIFECAKDVNQFRLPEGSILSAGEDDLGKDLIYSTDRELVVTPAHIGSLKSVFVDFEDEGRVYASDVANSADGLGSPLPEDDLKWNAFGESQREKPDSQKTMYHTTFGFAIASPTLLLQEGERIIRIGLQFTIPLTDEWLNGKELKISDLALEAFFSGADQWHGPYEINISTTVDSVESGLALEITLNTDQPPIVPFSADFDEPFDTPWPMAKVVCKKDSDHYAYTKLMELVMEKISLEVEVTEIKNMILQNDQSVLFSDKPFLPFGTTPSLGSAFYIGNGETFSKKLDELKLNIKWHEIPNPDLGQYYNAYILGLDNTSFRAKMYSLHNKRWREINEEIFLFNATDASKPKEIFFESEHELLHHESNRLWKDILPPTQYSLDTKRGFVKFELSAPDQSLKAFGHRQYPSVYADAIIQKANDIDTPLPNPPYTPTIKSITIDYKASQEIDFMTQDKDPSREQHFEYYYIEPFGFTLTSSPLKTDFINIFPQYQHEGSLCMGILDLDPPQNLSCLFQVAEGSGDPTKPIREDDIEWSYLSHKGWKGFSNLGKLFDSTGGLLTSGIITFQIPGDASSSHTLMPKGYHWLKAALKTNSAGAARLIDIKAQAVTATFVDQENDPQHLSKPLPSDTITELTDKPAAIKSVLQPFASFSGKMEEQS